MKERAETPYNKFMKAYGSKIRRFYNLNGSVSSTSTGKNAMTMIAQEYNVYKQINPNDYYVGISDHYIPQ